MAESSGSVNKYVILHQILNLSQFLLCYESMSALLRPWKAEHQYVCVADVHGNELKLLQKCILDLVRLVSSIFCISSALCLVSECLEQ